MPKRTAPLLAATAMLMLGACYPAQDASTLPPRLVPVALTPAPSASLPMPALAQALATSLPLPTPTPTPTPAPAQAPTELPAAAATPPLPQTSELALESPAPDQIEVIVDDRDPGFKPGNNWYPGDGGQSFAGGCHWTLPGYGNSASVHPALPRAGSYDIYAWGCGDPNHDQAWLTTIVVNSYGSGFVYAPSSVQANLKEDTGRWVPVGTYYMEPDGYLSIGGEFWGNVTADAFRFVYRTPEEVFVTPETTPTSIPWSGNPPAPHEQLTAGDLARRLGLVQRFYQYTPAHNFEEVDFDDCQAFPREGCGGTRAGWEVVVDYQGREPFSVPYRVSKDLQFVTLDVPDALRGRQSTYLCGQQNEREFCVYRYPDEVWQFVSINHVDDGGRSGPLDAGQTALLVELVNEYATIGTGTQKVLTPDGWELQLYGYGAKVSLDEADWTKLATLGSELGARVPPTPP